MRKKILPVILTITMVLSMVLSTGAGAYAAVQVTDIAGHRSEAAIREAIALGVIKGYPDGTYRPDGLINREEFFSIISNILTVKPDITNTKLDFIDVDPIEWYIPVVKTMVAAEITDGIGWDKVGIGQKITQQEAIKILATIIPTKGLPSEAIGILASDAASISRWAVPYYQIMLKKGYIKNTTSTLNPRTELTREAAAILLLKIKKGETVIAGNADEIIPPVISPIIPDPTTTGGCITTYSHQVSAGAFLRGNGSSESPYEISNQDQLNHMRQHLDQGVFFAIKNDIKITKDFETTPVDFMAADADWSYGNFRPIGTKATPFNGFLNGGGFKIEGLNIIGTVQAADRTDARELASYVGLFGAISGNSRISNLLLDNSQISGREYTGAIVGFSEGLVKNAGVGEGTIVKGGTFTGGIVGYNGLMIEECYSKVTITGKTATGALVGKNYGALRNSYWLGTSYPAAVGVSGMTGSIQEVRQLSSQEFTDQKIEEMIK